MPTAKVRKAVYGVTAVATPLLIVWGIEANAAAAYAAAALAVANLIMAIANVPGDE